MNTREKIIAGVVAFAGGVILLLLAHWLGLDPALVFDLMGMVP